MNNYTAPDFVLDIMRTNDLRFFKVMGSDGKSLIVHQIDDSYTIDQAVEYLERTFERVTGTLYVTLNPRAKMGAGGDSRILKFMVDTRDLETAETGADTTGMVSGIGAIEEKFNARIEALEQKYFYESKIKELERELSEAKEGNPMIDKVLSGLMPLLAQQPQAVAGTSGEDDGDVDSTRIRISQAVQRIMAIDPKFVDNIEALADLAENNTAMYNMAIGQLKNM